MALTLKKRLFADAILGGMSNKDAAIKAGYSKATASQQGSKLAKDADVIAYMAKSQSGEVKPTAKVNIDSADPREVLIGLMADPDPKIALKAATALMPFMYPRVAPAGKKESAKDTAKEKTTTGRFATLSNQTSMLESAKIQ